MSEDDWKRIVPEIRWVWNKDSYFTELKETEILKERLDLLSQVDEYIGRYYSIEWVRKNILNQTEAEIRMIDKQIKSEENDGEYEDLPDSEEGDTPEPTPPRPPEPDEDEDEEQEDESVSIAQKVRLLRNRADAALAAAAYDEDFE